MGGSAMMLVGAGRFEARRRVGRGVVMGFETIAGNLIPKSQLRLHLTPAPLAALSLSYKGRGSRSRHRSPPELSYVYKRPSEVLD